MTILKLKLPGEYTCKIHGLKSMIDNRTHFRIIIWKCLNNEFTAISLLITACYSRTKYLQYVPWQGKTKTIFKFVILIIIPSFFCKVSKLFPPKMHKFRPDLLTVNIILQSTTKFDKLKYISIFGLK